MDRLVRNIEIVAGYSLGLVALLVFLEAMLRYVFRIQIPDAYTIASQFQGMAIFWGFATATFAGRHITVDILWEMCPSWLALVVDTIADLFSTAFFIALAVMLYWKVDSLYRSGETTSTLQLVLWPFVAVAALGIFCCVLLAIARIILRLQGRAPQETGLQTDG